MAKFHGVIGFSDGTVETPPGSDVYKDKIVEYDYNGDVVRNARQFRQADKINDDLSVQNSISIVADEYARNHFFAMKYVEWAGTLWIADEVTVESPRLIIRLGGVYNGPRPV